MNKATKTGRAAYGTYSRNREDAARATRDAILEAAHGLFTGRGYDETAINHIAADAGITRQTFYLHFASKHEVLAHLVADFETGIMALYDELAGLSDPDQAALSAWAGRFLAYCEADRKTVLLLLATVPAEADLAQGRADLYQRIMTVLGRSHAAFALAASGEDKAVRARAVSLLGQIETMPRLAMTAVPLCDRQSLVETMAEAMVRFMSHPGAEHGT